MHTLHIYNLIIKYSKEIIQHFMFSGHSNVYKNEEINTFKYENDTTPLNIISLI